MTRTCKKCSKSMPITEFQEHDSGRRWVCRECRLVAIHLWEVQLTPEKRKRRERGRSAATRAYLDRQKVKRAAKHRERHDMLRAIVTNMYREGMNRKELAKMASVTPNTLRRIESEGPLEMGITQPIEEKILRVFAARKGIKM